MHVIKNGIVYSVQNFNKPAIGQRIKLAEFVGNNKVIDGIADEEIILMMIARTEHLNEISQCTEFTKTIDTLNAALKSMRKGISRLQSYEVAEEVAEEIVKPKQKK